MCFRPENHTQPNRRIDGRPPQREGGLVSGSQSGNVNGRVEENRLHLLALEELYAGIAPRGRHVQERFERDFEKARRILVPNLNDWTETGKVLARLANKYDYEKIGQGRRFGLCVGSRHAQQRHVRADDLFGTLIRTQRVG